MSTQNMYDEVTLTARRAMVVETVRRAQFALEKGEVDKALDLIARPEVLRAAGALVAADRFPPRMKLACTCWGSHYALGPWTVNPDCPEHGR